MSHSGGDECTHPDIRKFDGIRCCLSCGFALLELNAVSHKDDKASADESQEFQPAAQPYKFKRLNYELGREIRLIRLLPGFPDEDLHCSVLHVDLDDDPKYEAVSYTWATQDGKTNMSGRVMCESGTFLKISENCEAVLRRIRDKGSARTLWIDMLCIDQEYLAERNHQVNIMDVIYRQAQLVIVDLGDGTKSSKALFDRAADRHRTPPPAVDDFKELFSRRWFQRGWVLQEVALAKHAVVHCGQDTVSWNNLKAIVSPSLRQRILPVAMRLDCDWSNLMDICTLIKTLANTHSCHVADPRDRIYSLLGLCQSDLREQLPVDYSLTVAQLYLQLVTLYIFQTGNWTPPYLHDALRFMGRTETDRLPSWFPSSISFLKSKFSEHLYKVSQRLSSPLNKYSVRQDLEQLRTGLLKIPGRFLGQVRFVGTGEFIRSSRELYTSSLVDNVPFNIKDNLSIWRLVKLLLLWAHATSDNGMDELLAKEALSSKNLELWRQRRRLDYRRMVLDAYEEQEQEEEALKMGLPSPSARITPNLIIPRGQLGFGLNHVLGKSIQPWSPYLTQALAGQRVLGAENAAAIIGLRKVSTFVEDAGSSVHERSLFCTDYFVGFGPKSLRPKDSIWLLEGQSDVFALRHCGEVLPTGVRDTYQRDEHSPGWQGFKILGSCFYYCPETVCGVKDTHNSTAWHGIDIV
jgi:Heterokaryon incompatibility protein (HET)